MILKYNNDAIRRLIGPLGVLKRKIEEETGIFILKIGNIVADWAWHVLKNFLSCHTRISKLYDILSWILSASWYGISSLPFPAIFFPLSVHRPNSRSFQHLLLLKKIVMDIVKANYSSGTLIWYILSASIPLYAFGTFCLSMAHN